MTRQIRTLLGATIAVVTAVALTACDTGDGKSLRDPTGTLPPPTVPATTTEPVRDGVGTLAILPSEDPVVADDSVAPLPDSAGFALIAPWLDGGPVDARHTCDGVNVAPALSWTNVPPDAVELAIAVVDESITNGPPFVHWVIAGIEPSAGSLIEGSVPVGAVQALNFFGDVGWGGPCPPQGDAAHTYRFTVYALNQQAERADGTLAADLLDFVKDVSVASASVTGTFRR